MQRKCPKCGYTRKENEEAPEYECPRCGIVYEKYITRQLEKYRTQSNDKFSEITLQSQRNKNHTTRQKNSRFKPIRLRRSQLILITFLLFSSALLAYLFFSSDYFHLRWRYHEYVSASSDPTRTSDSYLYLSSETRKAVTQPAWENYWSSRTLGHTEQYESLDFSPDKSTAKIYSLIKFDGKDIKYNVQRWVKEDEIWHRDYYGDNPEGTIKIQNEYKKILNERSKPEITMIRTSWTLHKSSGSDTMTASPQTELVISNTGDVSISELYARIDYYDPNQELILSSVSNKVIDGDNTPLQPSERISVTLSERKLTMAIPRELYYENGAQSRFKHIEHRVFFKRSEDGEWFRANGAGK